MRKNYLSLSWLLAGTLIILSCKRDTVYGDITPNTERMIVEFVDAKNVHNVATDYTSTVTTIDLADLQFMLRSYVTSNATAKIIAMPGIVYDYNDNNGTSYTPIPAGLFTFESDEIVLSENERRKTVRIRLKPSDIATGQYALGLSISQANGAEVSRTAAEVLVVISVKNKYDGKYNLKGFYTRTDNPALHGPFETDVEMITTGPNSVAMYWPLAGDYGQPFTASGSLNYFTNVAPEVFFNGSDQVSSINNFTGDPAQGPFMTLYPGANNRFVPGTNPMIYLKYYYNTNPANRIFADTLVFTGPR